MLGLGVILEFFIINPISIALSIALSIKNNIHGRIENYGKDHVT